MLQALPARTSNTPVPLEDGPFALVEAQASPEAGVEASRTERRLPESAALPPLEESLSDAPIPPAGNLSRYATNWPEVTNNNFVLNVVNSGYKLQFIDNLPKFSDIISFPNCPNKRAFLIEEIARLLISKAVSVTEPSVNQIVSRVFIREKTSGGWRMIIDLKRLNKWIVHSHFKIEDKSYIKLLLDRNDFMISLDLRDAFHSISIHDDHKKFLCFEFLGTRYMFNVLPFGLTSAPRIFTKIVKPVIAYLRGLGLKLSVYLDDIIIIANSKTTLLNHAKLALDLFTKLGFNLNLRKSNLLPTNRLLHLGFIWDTSNTSLSLPTVKIDKIISLAKLLLELGSVPLRVLASFIGLLVSSHDGFKLSPLHYRQLQFCLFGYLAKKYKWEDPVKISKGARTDISWWENFSPDLAERHSVPFSEKPCDVSLYSDAFSLGWGAYLSNGDTCSGV